MAQGLLGHGVLIACIALAVLAMGFFVTEEAPVARRVFGRFLFNIALPLALIIGAPLVLLGQWVEIGHALWQAIIAGSVIAGGWLTTTIFGELARAQAKAERLRDDHKALFAEIRNALSVIWDEGKADEHFAALVARMEADPGFVPLIPRESHDHIYTAILDEIEVLPRVTIDAIVAYYGIVKSMTALAEDMRSEAFRAMDQTRRIAMYRDYFETRRRAFAAGEYALKLIREYSEKGGRAAEALASGLNTPAAARTARAAGSE